MTSNDKIGFKQMMDTVTTLYQKPNLDIDTIRVWFAKLEKYDFNVVTKAFDKHVDTNKFMPTVFDILQLCREKPIEFVQLQAPKLNNQQNKAQADKMLAMIQERMPEEDKKLKDMRAWAHRIIANPKNYPAISLKTAKEAINAK
jgi:thioester reductase-like protein